MNAKKDIDVLPIGLTVAGMITTSKKLKRANGHLEARQLEGIQALANFRNLNGNKPDDHAGIVREAVEKLLVRELKKAGIEYPV